MARFSPHSPQRGAGASVYNWGVACFVCGSTKHRLVLGACENTCYRNLDKLGLREVAPRKVQHRVDQSTVDDGMGVCSKCGLVAVEIRAGRFVCSDARKAQRRASASGRVHSTGNGSSSRRRILRDWLDEQYKAQEGECGICSTPYQIDELVIDHDHNSPCGCGASGGCEVCARGLLCRKCNVGIGFFSDDTEVLSRAIDYLMR